MPSRPSLITGWCSGATLASLKPGLCVLDTAFAVQHALSLMNRELRMTRVQFQVCASHHITGWKIKGSCPRIAALWGMRQAMGHHGNKPLVIVILFVQNMMILRWIHSLLLGGKMCLGDDKKCGKRIFHDKWNISPETAEARWAYKEAKQRELDDVVDFMQFWSILVAQFYDAYIINVFRRGNVHWLNFAARKQIPWKCTLITECHVLVFASHFTGWMGGKTTQLRTHSESEKFV